MPFARLLMNKVLGFEGGNNCQSSRNNKKISSKTLQGPLEASKLIQTKEGARFYLVLVL